MKRTLYILIAFLCLCACEKKENETKVESIKAEEETELENSGFAMLGVKTGGSYESVKSSLEERADDLFIDEALVVRGWRVGPTKFDEIRFNFTSYRGVSSLTKIELRAVLNEEETRYFIYFWNKEFGSKYKWIAGSSGGDDFCSRCTYGNDDIMIDVETADAFWGYECRININDNNAYNMPYKNIDVAWLCAYWDSICNNSNVFTDY